MRFTSRDGQWVVGVIRLVQTGNQSDGECFRISRYGFFVAEARGIEELRRRVDLAELEEQLVRAGRADGTLSTMSCWQHAQLTITVDGRAQENKRTVLWHGPGQGLEKTFQRATRPRQNC